MVDEYNNQQTEFNRISETNFNLMAAFGDMIEIHNKYRQNRKRFDDMTAEELKLYFFLNSHCSALFKVKADMSEVFSAHNSWYYYSMMNRIFKEYNFNYNHPSVKAKSVIFSSYAATLSSNEGIGIDLGIKDLSICSDGNKYQNINKNQKVKKLEKRKRRLQRSISRKYEKNKKGGSYCKTSNIIKSEKELLKLNHRLTNIRQNYLHQTTSEIVKREPSFICIEDLNVKGMMKNRHLSKAVQQQCFREFRRQIEYKSAWNNIPVIIADRFFPSSKLCSCCGAIKKDLKLSDRIYKCECGNVIDRDYQASLNLKRYGENVLKQSVL